MSHKTEQERFWCESFGAEYMVRNQASPTNLARYVQKWTQALPYMPHKPASVLELGCNIGMNLMALRLLLPETQLNALEINASAAAQARTHGFNVAEGSLLEYQPTTKYDLCFTSGVLIHIAPEYLPIAYKNLYESSRRYIYFSEYYNPTPVEVPYRGHEQRLFKRDFAGELMDAYPDLVLRGYGFLYHRDPLFAHGDSTWFVFEKSGD